MQAKEKRTEADLAARGAEIAKAIASGEGDIVALLEEGEALKREGQAARIAAQARADAQYRARIEQNSEAVLARRDRITTIVNDSIAHLLLIEQEHRELVRDLHNVGVPGVREVAEHLGYPLDLVDQIVAVVRAAAPSTDWNYDGAAGMGLPSQRPQLKTARTGHLRPRLRDIHGNPVGPGNRYV